VALAQGLSEEEAAAECRAGAYELLKEKDLPVESVVRFFRELRKPPTEEKEPPAQSAAAG
jgi:hypothetical protein